MRKFLELVVLLTIAISLAACTSGAQTGQGETDIPVVSKNDENLILAEAILQADERRILSFQSAGIIGKIIVEEGSVVSAGDLLAVLDPADALLAVRQAEAALQQAEAQFQSLLAGPRETDLAVLQAQIQSAQAVITQTMTQRDQLFSGASKAQITAAEANLAAAIAERVVALKRHDDTMKCYDIPGTDEKTCPALGDPEEQARYALQAAEKAVIAAETYLSSLEPGFQAQTRTANAGINIARAQEVLAASQLAQLNAGASPGQIDAAQAAVAQAQVAVDTAQLALERIALYAPISGTVTNVAINPGDLVAYGQGVMSIAATESLQVRTVDLTELDVVALEIGLTVDVVMDALPDLVLAGHISEISLEAVDYRGDVTYPVLIDLDDMDSRLRLGMTAEVSIQIQ